MMRALFKGPAGERGLSAVEFGLAAPFLAFIIVGMTDMTRAYSMKLRLEQAAQRAIEKVQAQGKNTNNYNGLSAIATTEATNAGFTGSSVDVSYSLECNGTASTSNTTTGNAINSVCTTGQTYARYVTVTITNTYTPMFTLRFFPRHNTNGSVTVTGYAGIRVQ